MGTATPLDRQPFPRTIRCLAALGICLSVWLVANFWFVPVFQSNDDVSMELLARGLGIAAEPTPHLLFVNILLGKVLNWLYLHEPSLSWYRILMTSIHLGASFTIAWVALSRPLTGVRCLLLLNLFALFELLHYAHPHFTITAAMPAQAAVLLWVDRVAKGQALGGGGFLLFVILWLLSGLVRYESFVLVMILALPPFLVYTVRIWQRWAGTWWSKACGWFRVAAMPFLVAGAVVQAAYWYNVHAYARSPGWEHFYEFNILRAQFTDYGRAAYCAATKPAYDQIGWSENDDEMLRHWFFANRRLYSLENFRKLLDAFPAADAHSAFWMGLDLLQEVADNLSLKMLVAAAVFPLLFTARRQGGQAALRASLVGAFVVCAIMLLYVRRFPPSVYGPVLAFAPCLSLALPSNRFRWDRPGRPLVWLQLGWLALLTILTADSLSQLKRESERALVMHSRLLAALAELAPRPDQLYVVWGGLFPYELLLTESDIQAMHDFKLLGSGFCTQSPIEDARLKEFQIDDIYRALLERDNVFMISSEYLNKYFIKYVREHYGKRIHAKRLLGVDLAEKDGYQFSTREHFTQPYLFSVYRFAKDRPTNSDNNL
jgi:hypothetical protein